MCYTSLNCHAGVCLHFILYCIAYILVYLFYSTIFPIVGEFEADALSYPPNIQCDFGYIHEGKTCNGHDYWRDRATNICQEKGKKIEKYGILVSCGTDMFQGVEYVCCKVQSAYCLTITYIV